MPPPLLAPCRLNTHLSSAPDQHDHFDHHDHHYDDEDENDYEESFGRLM